MSKLSKLVFFGNERLATGLSHTSTPTLKALIENGYEIAAVVSHYHEGRSRKPRPLEIAEVAKAHNIPLLLPENLHEVKQQLKDLDAEAAVLVAYGKIIPKEIIDIFPKGIINLHPSLLPKYRGPTPIEQVILDGVKETGVSIMQLTAKMDAGPVFMQEKLSLAGNEQKAELAEKLLELGSRIMLEVLPKILDGSLEPEPQNDANATYTQLLKKEDGSVEWHKPAEVIERQVRTFLGFPKSRAKILDQEVIITKVRIANSKEDGYLVLECQPGWLEIQELTAPSGRNVTGAEFLRGYSKH
jgi:methionyl-tRNA formyltransferase